MKDMPSGREPNMQANHNAQNPNGPSKSMRGTTGKDQTPNPQLSSTVHAQIDPLSNMGTKGPRAL